MHKCISKYTTPPHTNSLRVLAKVATTNGGIWVPFHFFLKNNYLEAGKIIRIDCYSPFLSSNFSPSIPFSFIYSCLLQFRLPLTLPLLSFFPYLSTHPFVSCSFTLCPRALCFAYQFNLFLTADCCNDSLNEFGTSCLFSIKQSPQTRFFSYEEKKGGELENWNRNIHPLSEENAVLMAWS